MSKIITYANLQTFKRKNDEKNAADIAAAKAALIGADGDTLAADTIRAAKGHASGAFAAANSAYALANSKYAKPSDGIPKSDLSLGVQAALDKASVSIQEHQKIATGSARGTISVDGKDVAVSGLGALAYQSVIYKSDIGLGNVENQTMDRVPTNNSDNYVTSGGVKDYVDSAIASVRSFQYEKLPDGDSLPPAGPETMGRIYLVAHDAHDDNNVDSEAQNYYDEYITICTYVNNENPQENTYTWEKIGNTDVDLVEYVNHVKTSGAPLGVFTAVTKGGSTLTFTVTNLATSAPTASGNAVAFIDSISQNEKGKITATKKTVSSASTSAAGLMSAADKSKLDGITEATDDEIEALFS